MNYKVEMFEDIFSSKIKQITEKNRGMLENRLNQLADQGWHLVFVTSQMQDGWNVNPVFIFLKE